MTFIRQRIHNIGAYCIKLSIVYTWIAYNYFMMLSLYISLSITDSYG